MWFVVLWLLLLVMLVVGTSVFEISIFILAPIFLLLCFAFLILEHYVNVLRKPLISVRGIINDIRSSKIYAIVCLLPDKNTIFLEVSKKQWRALKKNEHINIIYQGYIAHSIRKYPNGVIMFYDKFSQKKIEENADKILTYKQATKDK